MRRAAVAERIQIMPVAVVVGVEALGAHGVDEVGGAVDALRAGEDLLPAHEEVVAVGEVRVVRARVGVEGADAEWEFVEREEVAVVAGEDEGAEAFFLGCAEQGGCGVSFTAYSLLGSRKLGRGEEWDFDGALGR